MFKSDKKDGGVAYMLPTLYGARVRYAGTVRGCGTARPVFCIFVGCYLLGTGKYRVYGTTVLVTSSMDGTFITGTVRSYFVYFDVQKTVGPTCVMFHCETEQTWRRFPRVP